jgi:hypothetical protein
MAQNIPLNVFKTVALPVTTVANTVYTCPAGITTVVLLKVLMLQNKYFTNEIELNIPTIDTPNLQITGYTNVGVAKMFSGYTFYVSAYTDRGETLATKKFYYKKDGYLYNAYFDLLR